MEKFKAFCKRNLIAIIAVLCALIIVAGLTVFTFFYLKDKNSTPEPTVSASAAAGEFSPFPSSPSVSFETKEYDIENLGGSHVKFTCFLSDQAFNDTESSSYYAGSGSMGIMVYVGNIGDAVPDFSKEWITGTYLPGKNFTPDELYYSEKGDKKLYLAIGYDKDGVYAARGFVSKGEVTYIVSVSTVELTPPESDTQVQQIREAALSAVLSFDVV